MIVLAVGEQIQIPLALFISLVTISLAGLITFSAWLVTKHLELAKIQESMMSQLVMLHESDLEHHERLLYLERHHPSHTEAAHG